MTSEIHEDERPTPKVIALRDGGHIYTEPGKPQRLDPDMEVTQGWIFFNWGVPIADQYPVIENSGIETTKDRDFYLMKYQDAEALFGHGDPEVVAYPPLEEPVVQERPKESLVPQEPVIPEQPDKQVPQDPVIPEEPEEQAPQTENIDIPDVPSQETLFTIREAGDRYGIPPAQVLSHMNSGDLPFTREVRLKKLKISDLDAFFGKKEIHTNPAKQTPQPLETLKPVQPARKRSRLFTIPQAASHFRVPVEQLMRWNSSGLLPVIQMGRAQRVRVSDVEALLEKERSHG